MSDMRDELARRIARHLLRIGAVTLAPSKPFTWASGRLSPVYCDNRLTLGYPDVRADIARGFAAVIEEEQISEDGLVNWYLSEWIPRGAISFADSAYSTDIFLDGAFRHPVQIPDDIFPPAWRGFEGTLYW